MAKPKSKEELIRECRKNYKKLKDLVNSYPAEERIREFPSGTMNRNIRDVLAHLHHWHLLFLDWYRVGMAGEKPEMPAKNFTWRETPGLNQMIREKYRSIELIEAAKLLDVSFNELIQIIQKHTDEELFTKSLFKWTGTTSLGVYITANTSSHYYWAYQLIRKAKK